MSRYSVQPATIADQTEVIAHIQRHRAESGRGDYHFMPFAPDDPDGPKGANFATIDRPLTATGWQRWFLARDTSEGAIVGHVDLKGSDLKAGLHRCVLGIGIERAHRGAGLGHLLMQHAIDFARAAPELVWLDLYVFGHNANARHLYRSLGFQEIGMHRDRFRIEESQIDDIAMTLRVDGQPQAG